MKETNYDFNTGHLTDKAISRLEPFDLGCCLKGDKAITRTGYPVIICHHSTTRDQETEPCLVGYLLTKRQPHQVIGTREWFKDGSFVSNRSIKDDGDLVGMHPAPIESTPLKINELSNGQTYWVVVGQEVVQCLFEGQLEFFINNPVFRTKKEAEFHTYPYPI